MSPAALPVPGTRERQRAETRERLFEAGIAEIRATGLGAAQVDRIVAAVGVSRGTFYFHFPAKADLLLEWETRRERDLVSLLNRSGARPRPLRDTLLEVLRFLADLVGSPDGRLVLETLAVHVQEGSDPQSYLLLGEIERLLEAGAASGELRDDIDARPAAILFLSSVFGFLVTKTSSQPPHPEPELFVDIFLSGVTARPKRAARSARPKVAPRKAGAPRSKR
jgi:TetR/AcrR family transcriptional regulator, repressor for uid operon